MLDGAARPFAFGATPAAAVGPIALLLLDYGIRGGLRHAVAAGFGAALADLAYALGAFSSGSRLLAHLALHERTLRTASAFVLVVIGVWMMARAARARLRPPVGPEGGISRPLVATFILMLVNPLALVIFTGFAAQLPVEASGLEGMLFALSLFLGSLLVQMVFAVGGATLSGFVARPAWARALNLLSGSAITAFGIMALVEMYRY
jgi:threonine/homoserine/homoserine lactone efflux protein